MATNIGPTSGAVGVGLGDSTKFLKDLSVLIASAVAAAGALGAVWNEPSLALRLTVLAVVGLVTAFVGYAKGLAPWLARRRQQKVIGLVETDETRPTTFRLRPYEEADHEEFNRPDEAHEKALAWLDHATATSLYLTGFSGTGKSSLLQAWLIPKLATADRPTVTVVVRSFADPIKQLVAALKENQALSMELPKDETDARVLLEQAASAMVAQKGRLLIAIDQFEECLILQDDQTKAKLAGLFEGLQENPIEALQFLFVLRTDYLKFDELATLSLPDPRPRESWFNLEALSHADARKIFRQTLHDLSEKMEDEVIKEASVVDDLPGLIRPITLNMMGLVLKRFAGSALTDTTPGRLIQDFLRKVMAKPGIEQVAPNLLAEMITEQGTKKPSAERDLASATGISPALTRKTLYLLSEEGVVRELDRSQNIWEISHDFVARQLGQIIPRLKPSWWQRAQLAATPVAILSWLVILGAGYPLYQTWRNIQITDILRAERIWVHGEKGAYEVLFDDRTKKGAMDRAFTYVEALTPNMLTISNYESIEVLPGLNKLTALTSLNITNNRQLTELPKLDKLTTLTSLKIYGNRQLTALPSLDTLTNLTSLDIRSNFQLTTLPSLNSLANLTSLDIRGNDQLKALPGLDALGFLTNLRISNNRQLATVPSLDKLISLTSLKINNNRQLATVPSLDKLTALTSLGIYSNQNLTVLPSLTACPNLNDVRIWGNMNLIALPELGDLSRFEVFAFDANDDIEASIAAVKGFPETTLIKAHWEFLQRGYADQLNEARRQLGLAPAKVERLF